MSLNRKNAIASAKYAAISLLMLFFIACDDSTSAASSDPVAEISSSTVTSAGASAGSSSVTSAGSETSSSSVEKSKSSSSSVIPASSGDLQSSSSKDLKNSSSSEEKAKESSSSVKPSSSDAKSSSSEEAKTSSSASSSSVKSSSSFDINAPCPEGDYKRYLGVVYECVDGTWTKYEYPSSSSVAKSSSSSVGYTPLRFDPFNSSLSYGEFIDPRDSTKYATIDIDNKYGPDSTHLAFTVFAQNLKYHEKITLGANEQDDDTKVEMYCYNDSVEYCNDWWGGLYQWAEMMALPYECNSKSCADLIGVNSSKGFHQGICPEGWHIINAKEIRAAFYSSGENGPEERYDALKSEISFSVAGGNNHSGMSFLAAGFRDDETKTTKEVRESTYTWLSIEGKKVVYGSVLALHRYSGFGVMNKTDGLPVRCVKDY